MIHYLYDGTFEGLLTCVHAHYYKEPAAGVYPATGYQASLLYAGQFVATDAEQAERVYRAIGEKIGQPALTRVYLLHISNDSERGTLALRYLRQGFRVGAAVDRLHSHPDVYPAQQLAYKVQSEAHRLTGLLRFSCLNQAPASFSGRSGEPDAAGEALPQAMAPLGQPGEILYCQVEPDHDIIELLGDHFADRFRCQPFIIHDAKRAKALYSRDGSWMIGPLDPAQLPAQTAEEQSWRTLWRRYFDAIAIKERINPRCQRRLMPVRYWKNLTETTRC